MPSLTQVASFPWHPNPAEETTWGCCSADWLVAGTNLQDYRAAYCIHNWSDTFYLVRMISPPERFATHIHCLSHRNSNLSWHVCRARTWLVCYHNYENTHDTYTPAIKFHVNSARTQHKTGVNILKMSNIMLQWHDRRNPTKSNSIQRWQEVKTDEGDPPLPRWSLCLEKTMNIET